MTALTGIDRHLIAKAREVAVLRSHASRRDRYGEPDPELARASALGEAQFLLLELVAIAERQDSFHYHDAAGQENTPCLCDQPGTCARQAPNPPDTADAQPDEPCTEDGEQCLNCLRYTYDPHLDLCMHCGWQMHPDEED